jgi:hypothetical protein
VTPCVRSFSECPWMRLPEPSDGSYYELRDGDIVQVTAPKRPHVDLQYRLTTLWATIAGESYAVRPELPFLATTVDFYAADVGVVSHHRYDAVIDYRAGAPHMAIEVDHLPPETIRACRNERHHQAVSGGRCHCAHPFSRSESQRIRTFRYFAQFIARLTNVRTGTPDGPFAR